MPWNGGKAMIKVGNKFGNINPRTKEIIDKFASIGCDPLMEMAKIAMAEEEPVVRFAYMEKLVKYVAPQVNNIDIIPEPKDKDGAEGFTIEGDRLQQELQVAAGAADQGAEFQALLQRPVETWTDEQRSRYMQAALLLADRSITDVAIDAPPLPSS